MIELLAAAMGLAADDPAFWMPLLFMGLLFLLIAAGTLLDGIDIGVGILVPLAPAESRSRLMVMLSPWRDANEFWLLLGAGLFAAAFPFAWGAILAKLFAPLAMLMLGVMLRTVAFEFRIRASGRARQRWILGFWAGSVLTAFSHGVLLGRVATGYQVQAAHLWFDAFVGLCAVAAYLLLGATWLAMRVDGPLRTLAVRCARHAIRWAAAGMVAVSVALGLANAGIFYKWSNLADLSLALPIWILMLACFVCMEIVLLRLARPASRALPGTPFALCLLLFLLMLVGLGYSLFPYMILDDLTLWDGAAAVSSLRLVLAATVVAVPVMAVFSLLGYRSLFGPDRSDTDVVAP
ncbi:cytochrome d ubiquinol oxidase subunit II [Orrella sp. JC864]|uniref:cytochrome d ubiquinol oxidase subunit II n=1 Tax=Orrella sp. JC864 TaxID=3120298 RepID=UPI0012BD3585